MMIEKIILDYLNQTLADPVYMHFPQNAPKRLYVLERTGGRRENQICYATFALQSYGGSLYDTAEMNNAGVDAMLDAVSLDAVTDVRLNSDYNFTDTTRKRERYQAVFDVVHYKSEPPEETGANPGNTQQDTPETP